MELKQRHTALILGSNGVQIGKVLSMQQQVICR